MPENPNVNCLAGKKCPKCGSYGPFYVNGSTTFKLHDDGTESHDDVEFAGGNFARCAGCGTSGAWSAFDDKAAR